MSQVEDVQSLSLLQKTESIFPWKIDQGDHKSGSILAYRRKIFHRLHGGPLDIKKNTMGADIPMRFELDNEGKKPPLKRG